jgi:hypothetical protein
MTGTSQYKAQQFVIKLNPRLTGLFLTTSLTEGWIPPLSISV